MIHMRYRMVCKCRIQLWCNAGNVSWWSAGTPGVVECFVSAVERCERGWGLPEVVGVCLPVCVCVCVYESVSVGACVPVVYVYACRVLIVSAAPRCRWSNAGWQETRKDREREAGRLWGRQTREIGKEVRRHDAGGEERTGGGKTMNTDEKSGGSWEFLQVNFWHRGVSPTQSSVDLFYPPNLIFFPLPLISASLFLWPPPTGTLEGGRRWLFRDDWSAEGGGTDGGIRSLEVEQCVEQN